MKVLIVGGGVIGCATAPRIGHLCFFHHGARFLGFFFFGLTSSATIGPCGSGAASNTSGAAGSGVTTGIATTCGGGPTTTGSASTTPEPGSFSASERVNGNSA